MADQCLEKTVPVPDRRTRCDFASDAASEAVKSTFSILGVDVDDPRQVEEFRKSLRFGDSMRRIADKGMLTFVICLITALFAALAAGLKLKIGG